MNSPLFDLAGRVIVITGGAKGLGKTYSHALTGLGAKVTVADLNGAECDALAAEIEKSGGEALSAPTDVTNAAAVQRMAEATVARRGRIDALGNNAALMSVLPGRAWEQIEETEW